jgi:hypothetical protein
VDFAISELESDPEYNHAYCVFDRNGHANFDIAVRRARDSAYGRDGRLVTITSVPCFEIWVLLHYRFSAAAYTAVGKLSACDRALRDLTRLFPRYAKGYATLFADLADRMQQAVANAVQLEEHNRAVNGENPSTQMHHLVNYLAKLKNK